MPATETLVTFSPPEVARMFRVTPDKIRAWIESGQLRAFNIAENAAGERPRWRIDQEAIDEFKLHRGATPPTPKSRRKKTMPAGFVRNFR